MLPSLDQSGSAASCSQCAQLLLLDFWKLWWKSRQFAAVLGIGMLNCAHHTSAPAAAPADIAVFLGTSLIDRDHLALSSLSAGLRPCAGGVHQSQVGLKGCTVLPAQFMLSLYWRVLTPMQVAHMTVTALPSHSDMLGIAEVSPLPSPPFFAHSPPPAVPRGLHAHRLPSVPVMSSPAAAGTASADRACDQLPLAYPYLQRCRVGLGLTEHHVCSIFHSLCNLG